MEDSKSLLKFYLQLFENLCNLTNELIYSNLKSTSLPNYEIKTLKKFSFMVMLCDSGTNKFRWLLSEDQKDYVLEQLSNDLEIIKLANSYNKNINEFSNKFLEKWISFKLGECGMVNYFIKTNKDTEFITDFLKEKYLIKQGYEKEYDSQKHFYELRNEYRRRLGDVNFDPFTKLESVWGFKNTSFYYIRLPQEMDLIFIGIFPIFDQKAFTKSANFLFSSIKSAVWGANKMKSVMADHISKLTESQLKTAIITILVDSFAHNISAHSLSSIVWLYLKRTSELNRRFLTKDSLKKDTFKLDVSNLKELSLNATMDYNTLGLKDATHNKFSSSLQDLLEFMDEETRSKLFSFISVPYSKDAPHLKLTPTIPPPIDKELLYLLKYLKNKSAFWNGVTRDLPFGGEITHWYDILYEFSNNPLFLGTIAHSEGINRVVIRVGYNMESRPFPDNANEKFEKLTKEFLTIDISDLMKQNNTGGLELKSQKHQFPFKHIFLGEHFNLIRTDLRSDDFDVFLPGGIVGKHALYTIFENTIRNIKHVNGNPSEIFFNIFITRIENKLFQLYVWLGNESDIAPKIITDMEDLLEKAVVTEDGKPILGGSSQDKICASMLFNNVFARVEQRNITYKNHNLYPWIRIEPLNGEKNIKRSFFLWQGDLFLSFKSDQQIKHDNPSRFKFTVLDNEHNIPSYLISEYGLVRVVHKNEFDEISDDNKKSVEDETLYQIWNNKWIHLQNEIFTIGIGDTVKYRILRDDKYWQLEPILDGIEGIPIFFFHSETGETLDKENMLQYRNHGQLRELFFDQDFTFKDKACKGEFIETLLTNIVIFDNRIFNRVSEWGNKIDIFRNKLFLWINREKSGDEAENSAKTLVDLLRNGVKPNFIILHLSYIESLPKMKDVKTKYKETDIHEFINDYLDNILSENTKLVITTGRGRGLWWDKLRQEGNKNIKHILFKPIESILAAVEDGLIFKDDFMVKYNLVKILIGS